MPILTLTTDFGDRDYYQAALKGAILRRSPGIQIVDISHQVNPFDIVNAAYLLKYCYKNFPVGSIHLVTVDNSEEYGDNLLLLVENGQYFIGFDNGLFSLVFEERKGEAYCLKSEPNQPYIFRNYVANLISRIQDKKPLTDIGSQKSKIKEVLTLQPVIGPNEIRASVAQIDHYGNAITNLHVTLFESICQDRRFSIYIKKNEKLKMISENVRDVAVGELTAIFNDSGYLMIAMNMGNAASLLSLKKDDILQIDFKD